MIQSACTIIASLRLYVKEGQNFLTVFDSTPHFCVQDPGYLLGHRPQLLAGRLTPPLLVPQLVNLQLAAHRKVQSSRLQHVHNVFLVRRRQLLEPLLLLQLHRPLDRSGHFFLGSADFLLRLVSLRPLPDCPLEHIQNRVVVDSYCGMLDSAEFLVAGQVPLEVLPHLATPPALHEPRVEE
jgi:hypothetical protein